MAMLSRCHTLLRLRPEQVSIIRPSSRCRRFHSSPRQHLSAELFEASHHAFQAVHNISGLSWAASIFLAGGLFRLSWFPIQLRLSQEQGRQKFISPITNAWTKAIKKLAELRYRDAPVTALDAQRWIVKAQNEHRKSLYKRYGINPQRRIALSLGFLPIWIINADVIRRMTGQPGVVAPLMQYFNVDPANIPVETAFSIESFGWIPDLISTDPLYILPVCFGAIQYYNIWTSTGGSGLKSEIREAQRGSSRQRLIVLNLFEGLRYLTLLMPVGLIYFEMSTAVMLFLIGSATGQTLQKQAIDIMTPGHKVPTPSIIRVPVLRPEFRPKDADSISAKQSMDSYIGPQNLLPKRDPARHRKKRAAERAQLAAMKR